MIRQHMRTVRYGEKHVPYERPIFTTSTPVDDGSDEWAMLFGKGYEFGPLLPEPEPGIRILTEHRYGLAVRRYG